MIRFNPTESQFPTHYKWWRGRKVPSTGPGPATGPATKMRRDSQSSLPKNARHAYLNEKATEL